MYRLTSIQVPRFHQGPNIRASPPSRSCLTSIQGTSHLHPNIKNCISAPSHPIQVSKCAFHLNPGLILHTSMSREFVPHLLTCTYIHVSNPSTPRIALIQVYLYSTHHHSSTVSFPSWPMYLHLTSIYGTMCVPPASWLPITTIHVARIVSHLHHSPISPYPGLRLCVSTPPRSILNPMQVSRFVSQLHPGSEIHVSSSS